jgi:hypothetical protein
MSTPAPPKGEDRNQEATIYVGNVDERATEALIWELFLQAGPVVNVFLPKDRVSMVSLLRLNLGSSRIWICRIRQ